MADNSMNAASAAVNAAFAGLVHFFFQLDLAFVLFAAVLLFVVLVAVLLAVAAIQFRSAQARSRRMREIEEGMEDLRIANFEIKTAFENTKKTIAEVTLAMAKKTEAREKTITGELQLIEGLIRDFASNIAAKAQAPAISGPQMLGADEAGALADPALLEIVRRSLEDNRVDLYLQPIVSLPQRKVRFYEALSRLRSEDGAVIMPAQFIRIAAPAGLMSVVDNLLLFRCVQVVRRLAQRQREIAVFCNISAHTLKDPEFFPQFLNFMHHHRDLASQIVFEFTQESVLAARAAEEANLRYLSGLGFKLSMDQVTRLDVDFARARRLGFQFLKLRAGTLISGMIHANAAVAAEDFKDLLARNGLSLIVERVEDEKTVVQLLEYNVALGQGYLFGEPRAIRDVAEINDPRAVQPSKAAVLPGLARRLAG